MNALAPNEFREEGASISIFTNTLQLINVSAWAEAPEGEIVASLSDEHAKSAFEAIYCFRKRNCHLF